MPPCKPEELTFWRALDLLFPGVKAEHFSTGHAPAGFVGGRKPARAGIALAAIDDLVEELISSEAHPREKGGLTILDPYYAVRHGIAAACGVALEAREEREPERHADHAKLAALEERLRNDAKALTSFHEAWSGAPYFRSTDLVPLHQSGIDRPDLDSISAAMLRGDINIEIVTASLPMIAQAATALANLTDLARNERDRRAQHQTHDPWTSTFVQSLGLTYYSLTGVRPSKSRGDSEFQRFCQAAYKAIGGGNLAASAIAKAVVYVEGNETQEGRPDFDRFSRYRHRFEPAFPAGDGEVAALTHAIIANDDALVALVCGEALEALSLYDRDRVLQAVLNSYSIWMEAPSRGEPIEGDADILKLFLERNEIIEKIVASRERSPHLWDVQRAQG